jgi:hypothetical protein
MTNKKSVICPSFILALIMPSPPWPRKLQFVSGILDAGCHEHFAAHIPHFWMNHVFTRCVSVAYVSSMPATMNQ